MPTITVSGVSIPFPNTAASPDWSEAVILFAQTVANTISSLNAISDRDVQIFSIDSYNGVTNQNITDLSFDTAVYQGAIVDYVVYRSTDTNSAGEVGRLHLIYNTLTNSWEVGRDYTGNSQTTFNITTAGQVRFSNTALAGTGHTGNIVYLSQAFRQSA